MGLLDWFRNRFLNFFLQLLEKQTTSFSIFSSSCTFFNNFFLDNCRNFLLICNHISDNLGGIRFCSEVNKNQLILIRMLVKASLLLAIVQSGSYHFLYTKIRFHLALLYLPAQNCCFPVINSFINEAQCVLNKIVFIC